MAYFRNSSTDWSTFKQIGFCLKTQAVPCDIFMKGTPAISTVVRVEPMLTNKLTRVECKYNFNAS